MSTKVHSHFERLVADSDPSLLCAEGVRVLMLNVGLRCDLACAHCHHSCSPYRTEEMSRDTMLDAAALAAALRPTLVDITGGSPELHPELRELVATLRDAGLRVRVRTNLVSLGRSDGLAEFLAENGVGLLASLPGTDAESTVEQRGTGSFEAGIEVLRKLGELGYAGGDGLRLDIAYNPPFGEMPGPQVALEDAFRAALSALGVRFDALLAIANVPVGRFALHLTPEGRTAYADRLRDAFNPATVPMLACRHGLTVAWDGTLWDCDFNLAAGVPLAEGPRRAAELVKEPHALDRRRIAFAAHCFACTGDAGSS